MHWRDVPCKGIVGALLLVGVAMGAFAEGGGAPMSSLAHRLERIARDFRQTQGLPGLSITMGDNRAAWRYQVNLGVLSYRDGRKVLPTSTFRIASVSKLFTSVAALILLDKKLIPSLNAPIANWLERRLGKDMPKDFKKISLDNLITHTSGIRHYDREHYEEEKRYNGPDLSRHDAVTLYKAIYAPRKFSPGKDFGYSTFGINMVQDVVEVTSGLSLEAFYQKWIYRPAGLESTGFEVPRENLKPDARDYERRKGAIVPTAPINPSWKKTGGGMISTSRDLFRFLCALTSGKILGKASYQKLLERDPFGVGQNDYGRGIHVLYDRPGQPKWLGHGGGATGGAAYVLFREDGRFILTAVTNLSIPSASLGNLLQKMVRAVEPTLPHFIIQTAHTSGS